MTKSLVIFTHRSSVLGYNLFSGYHHYFFKDILTNGSSSLRLQPMLETNSRVDSLQLDKQKWITFPVTKSILLFQLKLHQNGNIGWIALSIVCIFKLEILHIFSGPLYSLNIYVCFSGDELKQ